MPITHLKSKAQVRAMFAAASGHSTLGIPQSVGKEFTAGTGHGQYKGVEKGMPNHVAHHSRGTPFASKKGDGRAGSIGVPKHKKVRRGANDGGPSSFAGPSFSGTGGQGNTSTAGQYSTSNP
jgi:hypothetical protein